MNPLTAPSSFSLLPLPNQAAALVAQTPASPRLLAHLRLVHDAAAFICQHLQHHYLLRQANVEAILWGAATHDIGKAVLPDELSASGTEHEAYGERLLRDLGTAPELARFARTHGSWHFDPTVALEDLLVALADTIWKGKRDNKLEERICDDLVVATGQEPWQVWSVLDELIEHYSSDAPERLVWQAQFPTHQL